jgi:hypothetical protein
MVTKFDHNLAMARKPSIPSYIRLNYKLYSTGVILNGCQFPPEVNMDVLTTEEEVHHTKY